MTEQQVYLLSEMEQDVKDGKIVPNVVDTFFHKDLHVGTLIFNRVPMRYYQLSVPFDKAFASEVVYNLHGINTVSQIFDPGEGVATVIDVANVSYKKFVVLHILSRLGASYILHGQYEPLDRRFRMENPVWQG